jgi:hypothetical protein
MLILALAAAAASLSAPLGTDIRAVFSDADMPDYLGEESDRSVGIRLIVRPDGKVQNCETEYSSGLDQLDLYTCKIAKRRARFAPASAQAGTPAYAVYRTTIRWIVTGFATPPPSRSVADLTVTVNALPAGLKSPAYVNVKFDVDERGLASSCSAEGPLRRNTSDDAQLVQLACDELLKSYTPKPAKNEQGTPVPSVQDALVAFATK